MGGEASRLISIIRPSQASKWRRRRTFLCRASTFHSSRQRKPFRVLPPIPRVRPRRSRRENEVARLENGLPLPPPRPPDLGEPAPSAAPQVVQPAAPAAPEESQLRPEAVRTWVAAHAGDPAWYPDLHRAGEPRRGQGGRSAGSSSRRRCADAGRAHGKRMVRLRRAPAAPQSYDRRTAVYDIFARTVYMPDGTQLEAHSGLGDQLDDPRYVDEQARGATPPHLYELTLREGSFHGVQALRLTPIGEGDVYGRAGLLAHPYMLGPNGNSNGCVSVKDYDAFLRAYENGQISRLMVVAARKPSRRHG